jgi:hypothetical protein
MDTPLPPISIPIRQLAAPTLVRRAGGRTLRYDSSLPAPLVEALWRSPEDILASGRVLRKTDKQRSTVLVHWDRRSYVMKHYGYRSVRHALKHRFAGSPAQQSYEAGCKLADAGVPTPRPVAAVENVGLVMERDSYLVYPYVEGRALVDAVAQGHMKDVEINGALRELKTLWRQLIALGAGLRDANTGNFIVAPEGRLWLIDLDDCRFHHSNAIARARLYRRWIQFSRNLRRAKARRDQGVAGLQRAA